MIACFKILQCRFECNRIIFYKICSITKKEYSVALSHKQCEDLSSPNRPVIQDVLPEHTKVEREFLITGTTPAEWDAMFPDV